MQSEIQQRSNNNKIAALDEFALQIFELPVKLDNSTL